MLVPGGVEGHLPDRKGEVSLVLATRPGQETPMDTSALEQGLCIQPTEVSVEPPGRPRRAVRRGPRAPPGLPCLLPPVGPGRLPHHPGGSPRGSGRRERGSAGESGQVETARAQPQTRPSAPRPPRSPAVLVLGLPLQWPRAAYRAGTGRGEAPWGELTVTSHFSRDGSVAVGVGLGPTFHMSAAIKGLRSTAFHKEGHVDAWHPPGEGHASYM